MLEEINEKNKELSEKAIAEKYLQEDIRTYKRKIASLESKTETVEPLGKELEEEKQKSEELQQALR